MYNGPIIDVDVHHMWPHDSDITKHLPKEWQALATGALGNKMRLDTVRSPALLPTLGGQRLETYPPDGTPSGSSYEILREQHLDRHRIERAVLTFMVGQYNALPNPYFAQAVVRAINDWNCQTWLSNPDQRLWGMMLIPTQFPDEAAAEIRRVGRHPRVVAALLSWNSLGKPFGHPLYHPIYEAAADMDLPVAMHINGNEFAAMSLAQFNAGGLPTTFFDFHMTYWQAAVHHVMSFIVHGVFDKYPNLRIHCNETSVGWIPWMLWALDDNYRLLKHESPSMRKLPSDYLREHIKFSTQPFDAGTNSSALIEVLEAAGGMEDLLMFSSDFPHYDAEPPAYISGRIPRAWHQKVFHDNALRHLRWSQDTFGERAPTWPAMLAGV
jgi:predicted TIM-barrel fold metal-dependent hydrolase